MGRKKQQTNEEIVEIIKEYQDGKDVGQLATSYNCSNYQIRSLLKKNNIELRRHANHRKPSTKSRSTVKLDYWKSKEGTPEFDYFIGILASDGCIVNTCVALELKDLEILTNYNSFLGNVCNINSRTSKVNGNTYYNIKYKNKEIVEYLSHYGIVPRKSNILELPYINWNILLGIFDGDGCISKEHKGLYDYKFIITSGSIKLITQVQKFLDSYDIHSTIQENKSNSGHWYNLIVCRGADIFKIYCNLYKESSFFLTRKKEKFCPLLEKFSNCNSVNSVKGMDNHKTEPSLSNKEGAETRNGEPKE